MEILFLSTAKGNPDNVQATMPSPDNGYIAIVTILFVTLLVLIVTVVSCSELSFKVTIAWNISLLSLSVQLIVFVYRHYVHKNLTSINFDNPVYRKTTEDQVRLKKTLSPIIYPSTVGEELRALAHDCPI